MTGPSSLPPLKKNDGKYGLIALLLLVFAVGLWFFVGRGEEPEPAPEAAAAPAEPAREQFAAELEIPEEEPSAPESEGKTPRRRAEGASGARPEDWVCNGRINASQVASTIRGAPSKQVQTCYERGLKGNNLLQGSMQVELTIGGSGRVNAVSVSGTLKDRQVYSCVKRVARSWQFPKPTDGCVRINVPFQMTPKL